MTIDKIDRLIVELRELKKGIAKMKKLSTIKYTDCTPKRVSNISAEKDWIGMDRIKRMHECHALAVEIGFADRRESYAPIDLSDGWHRYTHTPREPN
jgi:hypothetical protein